MLLDRSESVAVVSGDAALRARVARWLSRAGHPVDELETGEKLLAFQKAPRAVVADVVLPDMHGFELCTELRDRHGDDLPIILVSTSSDGASDRVPALLIGADDLLVAPINGDELLARLRRLLHSRAPHVDTGTKPCQLSKRELEVLGLLSQGVLVADIGRQLMITNKTVASHLQRIMTRLGVHTRAQAVAEAYRLGLVPETAVAARV